MFMIICQFIIIIIHSFIYHLFIMINLLSVHLFIHYLFPVVYFSRIIGPCHFVILLYKCSLYDECMCARACVSVCRSEI